MIDSPVFRRRTALAIAAFALGLWTMILVGRAVRGPRRESHPAPVSQRSRINEPMASHRALRVESFGALPVATAPQSHHSPRTIVKSESPASIRETKAASPLIDAPEAHETTPPEERSPGSTQKSILLSREEILKERDGVYGFGNSFYGATLGKGRAEFARPLQLKAVGQPRLSYEFTTASTRGKAFASGGEVPARAHPEERTVSYDRGALEERYTFQPDGLEQSFIIHSLPAGRGEIAVTGRVSTNLEAPPEGMIGAKLSFTVGGHEILTLSKAVAIDAAGNRLELALGYSEGTVTLTVPSEWVAGATLPITVDPLMGGPVVIDSSVTDAIGVVSGVPVRITDTAYNVAGAEWLVVWQEQFGASAFNYDVYGQRVSATGNMVGSAIPIGVTGAGEYEPAVSWASGVNRYLVAWRHDPADDGSAADQFIAGRIINGDGSFFGPAFLLDDAPGQDLGPSILFDGTRWLCVYTNVVSSTDTNVLARFVTTAGVPDLALSIDTEADLAAAPSVDVMGGTYLLAWQKGSVGGPMSIVARTMNASGAFLTPLTPVDQSATDCIHPDVSTGGGQFLIVWEQAVTSTDHNVVGRLATSSLTYPKNSFNIRTGASDQLTPRAQFSVAANLWYVVYSDSKTGNTDLYGNRVDTTGKVFGANRLTTDAVAEVKPELAWNAVTDEMLVVYLYGAASPFQIRAQRVSMDFTAPSIPGAPQVTPNPQPTGNYTVTWSASVEGGSSGFSNYDLQRSADGGAKWTVIASPVTESFADSVPHGVYLYRVRASDLAGNNSPYSPVSSPVVVDPAAPAQPLSLQQLKADGTTLLGVGASTPENSVTLRATIHDLGLLDGFEDANFTVDPMWTVASGAWGITTDGFKVLHDTGGLDDLIYTPSGQGYGSWEYRFRFPTIANGSNQQVGFYLFLDSAGLGGNGYEALVTAGTGSTKTVSLYRVDGATQTRIIGADANWAPDTSFHDLRVNRAPDGWFDVYLDGVLVGGALENTYGAASSTAIRHISSNANTLRVDHVRMSSAPSARSNVKIQVELKPVGTAFDGTGLVESGFVASGSIASVAVPIPAVGGYHWRSRVVDQLGNASSFTPFGTNAESDADFARIPETPPPAPSTLVATAGNAQVLLNWSASSGATSYTIKRSLVHGTGYANVTTGVTDVMFTDTGLQNGTPYYYVVTATGPGGESAPSNEASATPQGPPDPPTGLSAIGGDNQVFLAWTAPSGSVTYIIKRSLQSGGPYGTVASGVVPSTYTDVVANGTPVYYVVCAQNGAGIGNPSNEASATPSGPPPVPANFAGVALSPSSIRWSWEDVTGETGYRLHDDAHNTIATSGADIATITEAALIENTSYSRHVHGVFGAVPGGASNTKIRSTLVHDALAGDFVLTRAASAQVDVLVTAPPNGSVGNTGVQIERSTDGGAWHVVKPFSKVYLLHDFGLSPTAAYSYRIRFQNADAVASQVSPAVGAATAQPPGAPVLTVTPSLTTMLQLRAYLGSRF
jgi:hypothetical protein